MTVAGNDAGTGQVLNSGGVMGGPPTIGMVDSTVGPNTGTGIRVSNGAISLAGSTITQNTGRGVGATDGAMSVTDSTISSNGQGGASTTGQGSGLLSFVNSPVHPQRRDRPVLLRVWRPGGHELDDQWEHPAGRRRRWYLVERRPGRRRRRPDRHDHRLDRVREHPHRTGRRDGRPHHRAGRRPTSCPGGHPAFDVHGNSATGSTGRGGGIYATTGEVRVDNSTFAGNTAAVTGGAIYTSTGDVLLRQATLAGNSAPTGANLGTGEDLNSFASIVAGGTGGGTDCAIAGTTMSTGYNVGGDPPASSSRDPATRPTSGPPARRACCERRGDPDEAAAATSPRPAQCRRPRAPSSRWTSAA